jgi:5-methylcytosine-specific restriction enzyme subunit McrC
MTLKVRMREWEQLTPAQMPELANFSFGNNRQAQMLAEQLARADILEIVELRNGMSIRSTSYVGRLQLGELQITIQPKIKLNVLLTLFRYAYHLRDLHLLPDTDLDAEPDAFQDMLIEQLAAEASELIARGLYRQYRRLDEDLAAPKGKIDLQRIAKNGGVIETTIPVTHHPRLENCLINQVLLAGLYFAATLTGDLVMRSRLRRLAGIIEAQVDPISLDFHTLRRLRREMSRLTAHYEPAITLIELLLQSTGITLEDHTEKVSLQGFLFDMNRFFERLLSRFLNDNLPDFTVHDQYRLTGMMSYAPEHNPRRRNAPTPRPDFVITQGKKALAILDAKYRDLWDKALPREMLYQLALYALSQGWNGQSTILYPTMQTDIRPQVIEIHEPILGSSTAMVILQPVNLNQLTESIKDRTFRGTENRIQLAQNWIFWGR